MMQLAVSQRSVFTDRTDSRDLFEKAKKAGFEGVEIIISRSDLTNTQRLASFKQSLAEMTITISAIHLSEADAVDLLNDSHSTDIRSTLRRLVEWAIQLGTGVVIVPLVNESAYFSDEELEHAADHVASVIEFAAENSIVICCSGGISATKIRSMANKIDSSAFACCVDVASLIKRGMDPATEILKLSELTRYIHIQDIRTNTGDCPIGTGLVDFISIASALHQIEFAGWISLDTMPQLPEMLARDISIIRRWFPNIVNPFRWPRIGVFSYVLDEEGDDPVGLAIEQCQQHNIETIQVGGVMLDIALQSRDAAIEVRERLAACHIEVTGIAAYRNLISPDLNKRRVNLDFLIRCHEIAPLLGTSVVATETGTLHPTSDWTGTPENWSARAWTAFDEAMKELLDVAQSTMTILALEGYVNNVLATYSQLEDVLNRYPTNHLQVMLDPYNYLSGQLLPAQERLTLDFLERFEHRFVLAHLKDVAINGAENDTPEYGLGVFSQKLYLEYLRNRRSDLVLILEHLPAAHLAAVIKRVYATIG